MTQTMKVPTASEFISLLKFETEVKNDWIHKSVNKIFEDPDYSIGEGVIPFFADEIDIGIDTSGSTGNQHGCGRGGGRCGGNELYVSESGTDPIIAAEIKGVIYYLLELSKLYNLEGVVLRIYTFSDVLDQVCECQLTSNKSLDQIIRNMSRMLIYRFSGTNLMAYLKKVIGRITDRPVHMVLATDGQPNIDGNVQDVLDYIKSISDQVYQQLSMAIIGAGSIQSADGGGRGIISRGSRGQTSGSFQLTDESDLLDYSSIQILLFGNQSTTNYSECNNRFLLDVMNLLRNSSYLPSFGNFSKLRETAVKYLSTFDQPESEDVLNYKVVLDGGKQIDLPPSVNRALKSNKYVIGYCEPAKSWYFYTRHWQVAIDCQSLYLNRVYIVNKTDLDLEHLDDYYVARLQSEVGPFIVHEPDNFTFKVLTDYSGYWRCRQILQS